MAMFTQVAIFFSGASVFVDASEGYSVSAPSEPITQILVKPSYGTSMLEVADFELPDWLRAEGAGNCTERAVGCAWAGVIGFDVGAACDCGTEQVTAHRAGGALLDVFHSLESGSHEIPIWIEASGNEKCDVTVAGCGWAGIIGLDIGHACDCGAAALAAYNAALALHHVFDPAVAQALQLSTRKAAPAFETCTTSVPGCAWAGVIGLSVGSACDCGISQAAAYKAGHALYDIVQHIVEPNANKVALPLDAREVTACTTTVAGCAWAGAIGVTAGHACDCGLGQDVAYKAGSSLYHLLEAVIPKKEMQLVLV